MTKEETIAAGVVAGAIAILAVYVYASSSAGGGIASSISSAGLDVGNSVLNAISSFENVAGVHNNPGGICGGFDSSGNCTGPATFSSLQAGTNAAVSKIDSWIASNPALTVEQFVTKWSGATGTVLQNYIQHVADALGLDPSDPIANAGSDSWDYGVGGTVTSIEAPS